MVGEMRGPEANAAQEAARTGVGCDNHPFHERRQPLPPHGFLCKRAVDMSDETLMGFVTEAYRSSHFANSWKTRNAV